MNKKNLLSIVFFFVIIFSLSAQDISNRGHQQQLKTGVGFVFCGTGDLMGTSLYSEYHYFYNHYISVSPMISFMSLKEEGDHLLENENIKNIGTSVYVHPFNGEDFSFSFGAGVLLRQFNYSVATDITTAYQFEETYIAPGEHYSTTQYGIGYSIGAGFAFNIAEGVDFSFQEKLQNDTNGNITWDSQIGVIFSF